MHLAFVYRMRTLRWSLSAFALAPMLATSACVCGNDDQRAVTISALDSFTVIRDGATSKIDASARLTAPPTEPSAFAFVYSTLEGSTNGDGITLTISGRDPRTDDLVILSLALPVSIRQGNEYRVGDTFTIEPTVDGDPRAFGAYDLRQADQAEAAFSISTYTFPPAQFTIGFRAVTSTGTLRVLQREQGKVQFLMNLAFADANGKTATVTGRIQAVNEQFSRPCN
jgi:hypothetical protein